MSPDNEVVHAMYYWIKTTVNMNFTHGAILGLWYDKKVSSTPREMWQEAMTLVGSYILSLFLSLADMITWNRRGNFITWMYLKFQMQNECQQKERSRYHWTNIWLLRYSMDKTNHYCNSSPPWTRWLPFYSQSFQMHFHENKFGILIEISLKLVFMCPINNNPALV